MDFSNLIFTDAGLSVIGDNNILDLKLGHVVMTTLDFAKLDEILPVLVPPRVNIEDDEGFRDLTPDVVTLALGAATAQGRAFISDEDGVPQINIQLGVAAATEVTLDSVTAILIYNDLNGIPDTIVSTPAVDPLDPPVITVTPAHTDIICIVRPEGLAIPSTQNGVSFWIKLPKVPNKKEHVNQNNIAEELSKVALT